MISLSESMELFRSKLKGLSREELLQIILAQDPDVIEQINRVEYVFKNKLTHLTWDDGTPIEGRDFIEEELINLIDPPYIHSTRLERAGLTDDMQRQLHIASDPVLWAKYFLGVKPRVYQTLFLRETNPMRVMRLGRRMGKTFSMAVYLLWFSYTQRDVRSIVVAPMKAMVGLIYDEILNLATSDEALAVVGSSIVRNVASPQHEINFSNGSLIRFFTTGMKSNSKSDSTRGQEAHLIIADEMDYMGPEDLVALYAMLQTTNSKKYAGEKILVGASTPSGQRGLFWEWNTNPNYGFKSYWFPAYCNPEWSMRTERQMKTQYSDPNHYRQEIEADWGEAAEGVYPRKYVDLAFVHDIKDEKDKLIEKREWKYVPDVTSTNSKFVFGVDWDKYGAGVNVVVLEICNENYENPLFGGKIRVVYREEINKQEFTYIYAVERIEELSSIFRPEHIYVDRGAGETQIELLHKRGIEDPKTKLHQTVKGFQFSESIEVMDPHTQQKVKKKIKAFMIDNLYSMFQKQRILMSGHDDDLYLQIIGYIVTRQTAYGEPVFGPSPNTVDHAHDALILAAYAIADNYDDLLNPVFASKAVSISNQAFLPLFTMDNVEDEVAREMAQDAGKEVPAYARRSMSMNMRGAPSRRRGSFGGSGIIKRKMF